MNTKKNRIPTVCDSRFLRNIHFLFYNFLILLFSFTVSVNSYSQAPPDYKKQLGMPTVLPTSPDAASLGKFGNIPVSYATGIPDISVPIYTIKCGNLQWPISFAYHAGGIKVDEIASSTGLGWALNAPGVISRALVGRPDDESGGYEPNYTTAGNNDWVYLYDVLDGKADSEYDIFSFNFNGKSGKFIINQDGSILQIPLSNLKITAGASLNSFTITDENGITYLFDQVELTTSHDIAIDATDIQYKSSWYLSKVELPDKNNIIQFTYTGAGQTSNTYKNFHQAIGAKYPGYSPTPLNQNSVSGATVTTNVLRISGVSFSNGSIVFNYDAAGRLDGAGDNKLIAISINRQINGVATQIKKISLHQSYFYYNPPYAPDAQNPYRLRLDSLWEYGSSTNVSPKTYKFEYNATPMVPRGNYGQDIWGYNNGQYSNPTLLEYQSVYFDNYYNPSTYTFGNANRNVDTIQMKACMLSSITYPTGGKSTFVFDANVYDAEASTTTPAEQSTQVSADQAQTSTTTFTFPSNAVQTEPTRVVSNLSKCDQVGVYQRSRVVLKDLTTGNEIYWQQITDPPQSVSSDHAVWLQSGHNYEIKAYVYTNIPIAAVTASIKVQWNTLTGLPDIKKGGGLRIREIKHYSVNGVLAGTENYLYDTAVTLTPFYHIKRTYSEVYYRFGTSPSGGIGCVYYDSPLCRVYTSSSIYPIGTALGSFLLYKRVQKITVDATNGATNGKSEYVYDVFRDETYPVGGRYFVPPLLSNDWKNGFLASEAHYKFSGGVYSIVKKTENTYTEFNSTQSYALKLQGNFIHEGCWPRYSTSIGADATYFTYPIRSGSKRLSETIETLYDDNGNKIETHSYNNYASVKYDFPTKTIITDSKGNSKYTTFKYPPDFSTPGNVYEKMEQRNIIAPVIEQKSYSNTTLLNTVRNEYRDWKNDGKVLSPQYVQASTLNNNLENRLEYYDYDNFNNPLSLSKSNDLQKVYIWGYNKTFPVAEVIGISYNNIMTVINQSVLDNPLNDATLRTELNKIRINFPSAQVMSYTYNPLIGMTSQTDINGRTTYFFYDEYGRLAVVKDKDGKIVKKLCYNYLGQPGDCSLYGNDAQSGSFTKNDCSSGSGTLVTYNVPADKYYASTKVSANAMAQSEVAASGPTYANTNGTCTAPQTTVNGQSYIGQPYIVNFYDPSTTQSYSMWVYPYSTASVTLPIGTYNVSFSAYSNAVYTYFNINGYSTYGYSANFSSVYIGSGSYAYIGY
jgi:hypothetical protein